MAETTRKTAKKTATKKATATRTTAKKMATTRPATKKATAPVARTRAPSKKSATATITQQVAVDKAAEVSGEVLKAVEDGQRAAIAAVRRFVETVDEALPALGDRPSRREAIIDAALDMADRLVTTQYEFLRSVVRTADRSLGTPET